MKRVRKNWRQWTLKTLNVMVAFMMLFQPIGAPGMIAIAEELSPATAEMVEKETPKEEAPKVEVKIEQAEAVIPEQKTETANTDEAKEVTVLQELMGKITSEAASTEKIDETLETTVPAKTLIEAPAETVLPVTQEVKKETWFTDGKKVTTNEPVELDKEYKFPGNDGVVVKFTKLPENPGTLSIEEVDLSDKQVEDLGALSDTAYDITSTMKDGTFEYDLVLPKSKDEKNVQVKYAEKISELDEAKTVSAEDVTEKDASVKIVDLDHFTLFIVTYSDPTFTIGKSQFKQGEIVYLKAEGLFTSRYYRVDIYEPDNTEHTVFACDDGNTSLSMDYDLSVGAAIAAGWKAEIKKFETKGNCQSKNGATDQVAVNFEVVAGAVSSGVITLDQCIANGSKAIICHATSSGTNPYNKLNLPCNAIYGANGNVGHFGENGTTLAGHEDDVFADANGLCPGELAGPWCGDGTINQTAEQCDDGNNVDGDGCDIVCQTEISDTDSDSVPDSRDNCISVANPDQADIDHDLVGDACDNCPINSNQDQADADGDGLGDVCDASNCLATGEEVCDDLVDNDCDGQTDENCTIPFCGNGTVDAGEDCDSNSQKQTCLTESGYPGEITCGENCLWNNFCYSMVNCGDGIVNGPEQCDDGNEISGDGCENNCATTVPEEICGDGIVNGIENCDDGNINPGDGCSASCEMEKTGSISGKKFEDCNADGVMQSCESGMRGWTIFIDKNNDGILDLGEETVSTGKGGHYIFTNLYPGTYRICEAPKAGWIQTAPGENGCHEVVLNGEKLTGYHFGNFKLGIVSGRKFEDIDGNGRKKSDEPFLNDWTIRLYDSQWQKVAEAVTAGSGQEEGKYRFDELKYGTYYVCEAMPEGWKQTGPQKDQDFVDNLSGQTDEGAKCWKVENNCSGNKFLGKTFGNQKDPMKVSASKIVCDDEEDLPNWGDSWDDRVITETTAADYVAASEGKCHLQSGWFFQYGGESATNPGDDYYGEAAGWKTFGPTNNSGTAEVTIEDLFDTEQVKVREVLQADYLPFSYTTNNYSNIDNVTAEIYCDSDIENYDNDDRFTPESGKTFHCVAWNVLKEEEPEKGLLTIEKFNSQWPNLQDQGDLIDYTIIVRAQENDVLGVQVTDLLPDGFEYISGSSTKGSLTKMYASPGIWSLGDLVAGESVTITYRAKIGASQEPGIYKDLAFARGLDEGKGEVLATSVAASASDSGIITENFVGTQIALTTPINPREVELDEDINYKTKTKTKTIEQVLGASTMLPDTGADSVWVVLALIMLLVGIGLMVFGLRRKKITDNSSNMTTKIVVALFASLALIGFSGKALADAPVLDPKISVRISEPGDVVGSHSFKIGFVTMDIAGAKLSAKCFKVSSPDLAFPAANVEYIELAGGNSGNCLVDTTIAPTDGTYQFYVEAWDGNSRYGESKIVTVKINSAVPGTPVDYDRDDDSCTVTFKTANDGGLTEKVFLYRSDESEFVADSSSKVREGLFGSGASGSLTDPNGNCDDYYYVIQAVSAAGIGSNFVGDEESITKTKTKTKTVYKETEALTAGGVSGTAGGGDSEAPAAPGGNMVDGDEANEEAEQNGEIAGAESSEILGEQASPSGMAKNWKLWLLIVAAVVAGWWYYQKNRTAKVEIE